MPATDPTVERGINWLKAHQQTSGRWYTRSLNDDEEHYIADAGTCMAVMALTRSASGEPPRLSRSNPSDDARPSR